MEIPKVTTLINTHANKHFYYLRELTFSLAKEHKIYGEFGEDYIVLHDAPKKLTKELQKWNIKFSEIKHEEGDIGQKLDTIG